MANFKYNNNNNNISQNVRNDVCDWGRSKDQHFRDGSRSRSHIGNYLSFVYGQQLSPYELEERFCEKVGGISLQEVIQNQKYMHQHNKILEWKDSAVEQAFQDAKNRFWATIHGQPCNMELPDPDAFIDHIDWNSNSTIDPNLYLDLENRNFDNSSEFDNHDSGVVIGLPTINQSEFTPDGWGDAEEVQPEQETRFLNGWEDDFVYVTNNRVRDGENRVINGPTWNSSRKQRDYTKKGDHGGWGTSRYKISRYQHQNYGQPLYSYGGPVFAWKPVARR